MCCAIPPTSLAVSLPCTWLKDHFYFKIFFFLTKRGFRKYRLRFNSEEPAKSRFASPCLLPVSFSSLLFPGCLLTTQTASHPCSTHPCRDAILWDILNHLLGPCPLCPLLLHPHTSGGGSIAPGSAKSVHPPLTHPHGRTVKDKGGCPGAVCFAPCTAVVAPSSWFASVFAFPCAETWRVKVGVSVVQPTDGASFFFFYYSCASPGINLEFYFS